MSYGIKLKVWGDYALFTRPEMKAERVSYDVITPSAARGILEAIYWKPAIRWIIDRIHVLRPILFENIRRNELASRASAKKKGIEGKMLVCRFIEDDRQQRASLVLRDVEYVIEAHFELMDPVKTRLSISKLLSGGLKKGSASTAPTLAAASFQLVLSGVKPFRHLSIRMNRI